VKTFGRRARFWVKEIGNVKCLVCERKCTIAPGRLGICRNYRNIDGVLYNIGYGKVSAIESRPIEIKPLFHYWPNSTSTTFSFWGCNFYCPWCQNFHISFEHPENHNRVTPPEHLLHAALKLEDDGFSASFNEPSVSVEYILDLAKLASEKGLYFTVVTNGYQTINVIEELLRHGVDGWSIDIKGCPRIKRVLPNIDHSIVYRNAKYILSRGGHVEMVYLVVTNTNDFDECVDWILDSHLSALGPETPLHINRYYPSHRWSEPATPIEKLLDIASKAKKAGIEYVYVGNIGNPELESTRCPRCNKMLIYRYSYRVVEFNVVKEGGAYRCPRCSHIIPIRGEYVPRKNTILF